MDDSLFNESLNQPLKYPVEKIPNKYQNYLTNSKLRNQKLQEIIKKQNHKRNKVGKLEEGFNLYFNGANDRKQSSTAIAPRKSKTCEERGKAFTERAKSGIERSKWGSATKLGFLTERGDKIFVKPNNYYSDDFEEFEDVIDDEFEYDLGSNLNGISMELSLNEMKCLRESLIMNSRMNNESKIENSHEKQGTIENNLNETIKMDNTNRLDKELIKKMEDENAKIVTLELKVNDANSVDINDTDNDQRLRSIVDRVLKMNFNQQQKLLSTLDKIETVYETEIESDIDIELTIESNWGHPTRVGLTGIEFWDAKKQRIMVVNVQSKERVEGKLNNLINDKKDTSKEKNMWSTDFSSKRPICICFTLSTQSVEDVWFVGIWNFNKSLDSLSIGVQKISLRHSDKVLCEGIVDKALGNQVFNPPTMMEIKPAVVMGKSFIGDIEGDMTDEYDDDECLMEKLMNAQNLTFRMGTSEKKSEENVKRIFEKSTERNPGGKLEIKLEGIDKNLLNEESEKCNTNRKESARFGRRSELDECRGRDQLKELIAEFETTTTSGLEVKNKSENLEKSWSSLKFFNKSQAGRLSLDYTGDILDKYVDQIKKNQKLDEEDELEVEIEEEFVIPELPKGKELVINILSTWGDPHYIGLTGIEMFASTGDRVTVRNISADPPDINILPGYGTDPRIITNLLDGVNKTHDDVHMWLAPFTTSQNHLIRIEFEKEINLALLRIWNYNKSRIHSSRGARDVEIKLNGTLIFKGEIARAFQCSEIEEFGEVILFTSDDQILDRIGQNDQEFVDSNQNINNNNINADGQPSTGPSDETKELLDSLAMRPSTAKQSPVNDKKPDEINRKPTNLYRPFTSTRPVRFCEEKEIIKVKLSLVETWGDQFYIGLTGLEFVGDNGDIINVDTNSISTDMQTLQDDSRRVENIIDGTNLTTIDEHMWLAPFNCNEEHCVTISVESASKISSIRIWNYNKSLEDSYRGVKILHIWIDNKRVSSDEGYFIRRAPGHVQYDFVQEIQLKNNVIISEDLSQFNHLPCGFVYQFNIFSSWNDLYYVGLNGIEIYDQHCQSISINHQQVYAYPDSVNSLTPKNQRTFNNLDVRTPDKLIDGINDSYDAKHMWLAPILPGCLNRIFFVFDRPVCVSMIKIWNYSKTPSRGVKDFSILVDDLLIYSGTLHSAASSSLSRGILPNMNETIAPLNHHKTVLFDRNNRTLLSQEKLFLLEHNISSGQDVILINDNDINSVQCANQKYRPMTSVKGRTMVK